MLGKYFKIDNTWLLSNVQVDATAPPQKKMDLFWLLDECLKGEEDALMHIREMEDEVRNVRLNKMFCTNKKNSTGLRKLLCKSI